MLYIPELFSPCHTLYESSDLNSNSCVELALSTELTAQMALKYILWSLECSFLKLDSKKWGDVFKNNQLCLTLAEAGICHLYYTASVKCIE